MATALQIKPDSEQSMIDTRALIVAALSMGTAARRNLTFGDYDEIIRSADEILNRMWR